MCPDAEGAQRAKMSRRGSAIRPETTPPLQPTPERAQVLVTWKGEPDVVMIHSDLEEDPLM